MLYYWCCRDSFGKFLRKGGEPYGFDIQLSILDLRICNRLLHLQIHRSTEVIDSQPKAKPHVRQHVGFLFGEPYGTIQLFLVIILSLFCRNVKGREIYSASDLCYTIDAVETPSASFCGREVRPCQIHL